MNRRVFFAKLALLPLAAKQHICITSNWRPGLVRCVIPQRKIMARIRITEEAMIAFQPNVFNRYIHE